MLEKGTYGYIAYIVVAGEPEKKPEDVEVVKEFLDVFLEDLFSLLADREIEFTIELLLETSPISIRTYRMEPTKL